MGFPPVYMPFTRDPPERQKLRELKARRQRIVNLGARVAELRDSVIGLSGDPAVVRAKSMLVQTVQELHRSLEALDRDIEALRHQSK